MATLIKWAIAVAVVVAVAQWAGRSVAAWIG